MLLFLNIFLSFISNYQSIITSELAKYSKMLEDNNLNYHIMSTRIKTFPSAIIKHRQDTYKNRDIYELHDLIGFRFVFYNKEDLYRFYHLNKKEKTITYSKNYLLEPKENNYKSFHFRYRSRYSCSQLKTLECQLYVIEDYYDSLYGCSAIYKNYSNLNY